MVKERKERKILDREPKIIPGMEDEKVETEPKETTEPKPKREKKLREGEIDYGWCDEEDLPTVETTFDEDEEIVSEKTNRKVIR